MMSWRVFLPAGVDVTLFLIVRIQIVGILSIMTLVSIIFHKELFQLQFLKNGAIAWINAMVDQVVRVFCKE